MQTIHDGVAVRMGEFLYVLCPESAHRTLDLFVRHSAAFSAWLRLRHHERGQHSDLADLRSVGVLLTPRTDGYREWDTSVTAVGGDLELSEEELRTYQALFNTRGTPVDDDAAEEGA